MKAFADLVYKGIITLAIGADEAEMEREAFLKEMRNWYPDYQPAT